MWSAYFANQISTSCVIKNYFCSGSFKYVIVSSVSTWKSEEIRLIRLAMTVSPPGFQ